MKNENLQPPLETPVAKNVVWHNRTKQERFFC